MTRVAQKAGPANVLPPRGPTLGEILYALPEITEIILPTEIRNHSRRVLSFVKLRFPFTSRDAYTALYLGSYN